MKKIAISILVCAMLIMSLCLVACDSKVEFKVDFVVDGEIYSTINTSGKEVISIPKNPTKDGYEFDGWYWDDGKWQKPFTANSLLDEPLSSDMSVYAKWNEIQPEPAPELSGVDISSADLTVSGETVTATIPNATQTFSFLNDITVAEGATYILAKDIGCENAIASKTVSLEEGDNTYYLLVTNGNVQKLYTVTIRRRPIYTVEFNTNGGTSVGTIYVEENSTIEMKQTSKTGYTFDCWTVDDKQVEFPYQVKKNESFVAKWQACENKLVFDGNGATSGSMIDMFINTDKTVALPNNIFEKTGYTFKGWSTTANGSAEFVDGENYTMGVENTYRLYAVWEKVNYRIIYNLDGGENGNNLKNYAIDQEITLEPPQKPGYTFEGWYDNSTFDGESITKINKGSTGEKQFYAKWSIITYSIDYVLDGGTNSINNKVSFTIKDLPINLDNATKKYHTFVGWFEDANCTIKSQKITELKNITIYAKFKYGTLGVSYVDYGSHMQVSGYSGKEKDVGICSSYNGKPVTTIGGSGSDFNGYIESIEIPDSILAIGVSVLEGIDSLRSIIVDQNNTRYQSIDGVLYSKDGKNLIFYPKGRADSNFIIPDSVNTIEENAFRYCDLLTGLTISKNVTCIEDMAFLGCYRIVEIYNLSSLTITNYGNAGEYAMKIHTSLESPSIREETTDGFVFAKLFENYIYLVDYLGNDTNIVLPENFDGENYRINRYAFYNRDDIKSVTTTNGVIAIGKSAFWSCDSLESITISNSITNIENLAFCKCNNLKSIYLHKNITVVGIYAFKDCEQLTIYCEAESKPSGWNTEWNSSNCPVVWGYTGE